MTDLLGKKVKHLVKYGEGTVTEQEGTSITVEFPEKTCKFRYPFAFEKFLAAEDKDIADAIAADLKVAKEAEKKAEAEAAAKRDAEKQTRLEALKAQTASSKKKKTSTAKAYKQVRIEDGQPLTYLVFQGDTFNQEKNGGYIWVPQFSQEGSAMHNRDVLMNVRAGDIIFHSADGSMQAISRAKGPCIECPRPGLDQDESSNREKDGLKIECDYIVFSEPLKHGDYKDIIQKYCNVKYAPFDKDGNGNTGHFYDLDPDLAAFFIKEISKDNPEVLDFDFLKFLLVK